MGTPKTNSDGQKASKRWKFKALRVTNLSDISIEIGLPRHLDDLVNTLGGAGGEIALDDIQV